MFLRYGFTLIFVSLAIQSRIEKKKSFKEQMISKTAIIKLLNMEHRM
jgi:hypothetical protein